MKRIGTLRLQSCLWLIGCLLLPVNDIQSQTLTRDTLVNLLHDEAQFYLDKLKEKEIYAAVGWLAREGKVSISETEADVEVVLL